MKYLLGRYYRVRLSGSKVYCKQIHLRQNLFHETWVRFSHCNVHWIEHKVKPSKLKTFSFFFLSLYFSWKNIPHHHPLKLQNQFIFQLGVCSYIYVLTLRMDWVVFVCGYWTGWFIIFIFIFELTPILILSVQPFHPHDLHLQLYDMIDSYRISLCIQYTDTGWCIVKILTMNRWLLLMRITI